MLQYKYKYQHSATKLLTAVQKTFQFHKRNEKKIYKKSDMIEKPFNLIKRASQLGLKDIHTEVYKNSMSALLFILVN